MKNFIIVLFEKTNKENIDKMKTEANKGMSTLFFDADKKHLKHLNSVKNVFYNHCEADYFIVFTTDKIIHKALHEMYSEAKIFSFVDEAEFLNYLKGDEKNVL